jgi:hypothetical protein
MSRFFMHDDLCRISGVPKLPIKKGAVKGQPPFGGGNGTYEDKYGIIYLSGYLYHTTM